MFDSIVALDWAKSNLAIARLKKDARVPKVFETKADIEFLKQYLDELPGTVQLVFEISSSARKLFFELRDYVDDIIACDPLKNDPIKKGAKTDKIDAIKLALLARDNRLKNVYMDQGENFKLRRLVSGYTDKVKALVRCKNHRADFEENIIDSEYDRFVVEQTRSEIETLGTIKSQYEDKFKELGKSNLQVKLMAGVPGIGTINAVKLVATVVSADRFQSYKDYWGYCGLARYLVESGKRSYGTRKIRYNPMIKSIYKTAALVAINTAPEFRKYFDYLTTNRMLPDYNARNAIARHIAKMTLMMLKHNTKYNSKLVLQKIKAQD